MKPSSEEAPVVWLFRSRSKQCEKWLHDMVFFQTMSGNETIAYYCLDIFKRAKVTMMNNYTLSILLQTAFTTGYVISAFIMNHVPRRIQFMSSALFMAVSTATLGFTLNQSVQVCIPWVLSMSLVQFIWFPDISWLKNCHFCITRTNTD